MVCMESVLCIICSWFIVILICQLSSWDLLIIPCIACSHDREWQDLAGTSWGDWLSSTHRLKCTLYAWLGYTNNNQYAAEQIFHVQLDWLTADRYTIGHRASWGLQSIPADLRLHMALYNRRGRQVVLADDWKGAWRRCNCRGKTHDWVASTFGALLRLSSMY